MKILLCSGTFLKEFQNQSLGYLRNSQACKKVFYFGKLVRVEIYIEMFLVFMLAQNCSNFTVHEIMIPENYSVQRGESPWHGLTNSWEEEEKGKIIHAMNLPANGYYAVNQPHELMWKGESILYRNDSKREVAIDQKYFSTLNRVDATSIAKGQSLIVGRVVDSKLFDPNFLIPFLIKGQILITYIHTDSELIWRKNFNLTDKSCYHFSGEHHFYTNEKNTSSLNFKICLDQMSQEIKVVGE